MTISITRISKSLAAYYRRLDLDGAAIGPQAAMLTLATLFAIVPLATFVVGLISASPAFQQQLFDLTDQALQQFLPEKALDWQLRLSDLAAQAENLQVVNWLFLFVSLLFLMNRIDLALYDMFRIEWRRRKKRWLHYMWIMPVILIGVMFLMAAVVLLQIVMGAGLAAVYPWVDRGSVPVLWLTLAVVYQISSRRSLSMKPVLIVSLAVTLILIIIKSVFTWLYLNLPNWSIVFGIFSAFPLLLLWIQLVWSLVLIGARMVVTPLK